MAEHEAQAANSPEALKEAALKKRRLVQAPLYRSQSFKKQPSSNRRPPGSKIERVEISAKQKFKYALEMEEATADFVNRNDFWKAQVRKYGLSRRSLQHILRKKLSWKQLTEQPQLKNRRRRERTGRTRAKGAGRKVPFADIISGLRQWLSIERACGHYIAKADLLAEFMARLQSSANALTLRAEDPDLSKLEKGDLLLEAQTRSARKGRLNQSQAYRKTMKNQLIRWLDAKYMASELVSSISATEERVRIMLTWQQFDYCLWLSCCASEETLAESQEVAHVKDFIKSRSNLVIGFSDQVPLWAKATGRRAVFAEEEIHKPSDVSDFSEVREAIRQVMHSDSPPETMVDSLVQKHHKQQSVQRQNNSSV